MIARSALALWLAIVATSPKGLHYACATPDVVQAFRPAARVVQPFRAASVQCADWTDCRQQALAAAERKDYEPFHDLAWRAVQLGPPNDPSLLFLLARAQSLSGRPHDALVMLRRLTVSGVAKDALTSDEFAIVRTLRDWPEIEAALKSGTEPPPSAGVPRPSAPPAETPDTPAPPAAVSKPAATAGVPAAFTFSAPSFHPSALAYDAVSRRFIISDADVSRLAVIDEFTHHVATLASGKSAGFGTITAIEIEPRVGNLWVASVDSSSGEDRAMLHKLQLISGRVLKGFTPGEPGTRFTDIAVRNDDLVLAVANGAGNVLRLRAGAASFETLGLATHDAIVSVAVAGDGTIYTVVPHGIRAATGPLGSDRDTDLAGVARIRWHRGSLIGLQRNSDESYRAVRIRLSADGRTATRVDVIDPQIRTPSPAAMTIVDGVLYYLAETNTAGEFALRRIQLK